MKPTKPGKVYGYARASTEEQETTLDAQEHAIREAFAKRFEPQGYAWGGFFADRGITGGVKLASRQEGHKLCLALERGDVFIVHKLDRCWRSMADFCQSVDTWKERGVAVTLLVPDIDTSTPSGLLIAHNLVAVAQYERAMVGERMKHFFAQRKRAGRPYCPSAPYGFKIVGPKGNREYAPFPEQRAIGRRVVEWRDAGWAYDEIALHLGRYKVVNPRTGKSISPSTVLRWEVSERELQAREAAGLNCNTHELQS